MRSATTGTRGHKLQSCRSTTSRIAFRVAFDSAGHALTTVAKSDAKLSSRARDASGFVTLVARIAVFREVFEGSSSPTGELFPFSEFRPTNEFTPNAESYCSRRFRFSACDERTCDVWPTPREFSIFVHRALERRPSFRAEKPNSREQICGIKRRRWESNPLRPGCSRLLGRLRFEQPVQESNLA